VLIKMIKINPDTNNSTCLIKDNHRVYKQLVFESSLMNFYINIKVFVNKRLTFHRKNDFK